jgi:hypothetical protein
MYILISWYNGISTKRSIDVYNISKPFLFIDLMRSLTDENAKSFFSYCLGTDEVIRR